MKRLRFRILPKKIQKLGKLADIYKIKKTPAGNILKNEKKVR